MQPRDALLTWVKLRDINTHCVSLSARASYIYNIYLFCINLHCLVSRDTRAFIGACPEILIRKLVVSGLEPSPSSYEASL